MTIPTSQLEVTTRISEQEKGGYRSPQFRKYCTVPIRESYRGTAPVGLGNSLLAVG